MLTARLRDLTESRAFAELLIDCEEDRAAWAVVFGLLAEMNRK